MRIDASYKLPADPQIVWDTVLDRDVLEDCIPGCESLTPDGEDAYLAQLNVGVATIKGRYSGRVSITDRVEPSSYNLLIEGRGSKGDVQGRARVTLEQSKPGETVVTVSAEAEIAGLFSRLGQRMLSGAARVLMNQFFNCMKTKVRDRARQAAVE